MSGILYISLVLLSDICNSWYIILLRCWKLIFLHDAACICAWIPRLQQGIVLWQFPGCKHSTVKEHRQHRSLDVIWKHPVSRLCSLYLLYQFSEWKLAVYNMWTGWLKCETLASAVLNGVNTLLTDLSKQSN